MAAPKAQAQPKQEVKSKPAPVWLWLVVGVVIGLFAAFLTYVATNKPDGAQDDKPAVSTPESKTSAPKAATPPPATKEPHEPRFTFYTDLQNMKVEIPKEEIERLSGDNDDKVAASKPSSPPPQSTNRSIAPVDTAKPNAAAPVVRGHAYVLQAGSFKSHREADQLKARIAFMGITANIQAVTVGGGDRWYRVRVGPYGSQKQADDIKRQLKDKNIAAIVLKLSQ